MTVFWRYWLLQIPGWGVLTALLVVVHRWFEISPLVGAAIFAAWIVKDVALYPMLRGAYQLRSEDAAASLVGAKAVAQEALSPRGYVRLRGELWAADAGPGESISPGETVTVESVDGLMLTVRRG